MRPINFLPPALPVQHMKTYALLAPLSTHTRVATCAEVECGAHAYGWTTTVDTNTVLGARQANYIRLHGGRAYTATERGDGMVTFAFPPGQRCFTEHRVSLQREPAYLVRSGDWRGEPLGQGGRVLHTRSHLWVEDFALHQQSVAGARQRG